MNDGYARVWLSERFSSGTRRSVPQAQTAAAQTVAAAQGHLLRCVASQMARIASAATPRIWPCGARNAARRPCNTGC